MICVCVFVRRDASLFFGTGSLPTLRALFRLAVRLNLECISLLVKFVSKMMINYEYQRSAVCNSTI